MFGWVRCSKGFVTGGREVSEKHDWTALYLPLAIPEKTVWRRDDWPFCFGHQQLARSSDFPISRVSRLGSWL